MQESEIKAELALQNQFENGANWFFWIAALSLLNSVISLANGEWAFIVGMGVTQIIDGVALAFAEEAGSTLGIKAFAIFLDVMAVSVFVFFGVFARKREVTW